MVFLNFILFFDFFYCFKSLRANPVVCYMSKSMLYIQFGPYICYFFQFSPNFVPIKDVTKFNIYIKVIMM